VSCDGDRPASARANLVTDGRNVQSKKGIKVRRALTPGNERVKRSYPSVCHGSMPFGHLLFPAVPVSHTVERTLTTVRSTIQVTGPA